MVNGINNVSFKKTQQSNSGGNNQGASGPPQGGPGGPPPEIQQKLAALGLDTNGYGSKEADEAAIAQAQAQKTQNNGGQGGQTENQQNSEITTNFLPEQTKKNFKSNHV